ncbi:MAG: hypothetical protein IT437_12680 [Phycisphaerales bacterium]|nr:hypothetical protein [Phycisphaerales bacterium]
MTGTETVAELLRDMRGVRDQKDDLNSQLAVLADREAELQAKLRGAMCAAGLDKDGGKVAGDGLSVTWREKWKANYEPQKWAAIVKWAVESGNDHIIQRRLTDAKVMSIVDSGGTLPDGLSVEAYTALDIRRT